MASESEPGSESVGQRSFSGLEIIKDLQCPICDRRADPDYYYEGAKLTGLSFSNPEKKGTGAFAGDASGRKFRGYRCLCSLWSQKGARAIRASEEYRDALSRWGKLPRLLLEPTEIEGVLRAQKFDWQPVRYFFEIDKKYYQAQVALGIQAASSFSSRGGTPSVGIASSEIPKGIKGELKLALQQKLGSDPERNDRKSGYVRKAATLRIAAFCSLDAIINDDLHKVDVKVVTAEVETLAGRIRLAEENLKAVEEKLGV